MANTTVQLKKSGVTGNVPPSLSYGELALNYADGKLFYKASNGSIASISTSPATDSFATINANSSLILATSPYDTLSTPRQLVAVIQPINLPEIKPIQPMFWLKRLLIKQTREQELIR